MELERLTSQEFRRKIAGFEDRTKISEPDRQNIKEEAVRFATILARLFSDDLDRKTLWDRIGSGLVVAHAKCGGDIDSYINHCLVHIKAEPSKVAACNELTQIIESYSTRGDDWKRDYLSYVSGHHYIILVYARSRWSEIKEGKVGL